MDKQEPLGNMPSKDLKQLAKERQIAGWHEMRKAQLLEALESKAFFVKKTADVPNEKRSLMENEDSTELLRKKKTKKEKKKSSITNGPSKSNGSESKKEAVKRPAAATEKKKAEKKESEKKSAEKKEKPQKSAKTVSKTKAEKPAKSSAAKDKKGSAAPAAVPVKKKSSPPRPTKTVRSKLAVFTEKDLLESRLAVERQTQEEKSPAKDASMAKKVPEIIDLVSASSENRPKAGFLKDKYLLDKTLETPITEGAQAHDQLVLVVCGPFWLHTWWEISGTLIARIRSAMGHLWHTADPVLRLYRILNDTAEQNRREYLADIIVHGGVYNWYISVDSPPSSFLVELGYKARDGQFFSLVSSNIVKTPQDYVNDGFGPPEMAWRGVSPFGNGLSPYDKRTPDRTASIPSLFPPSSAPSESAVLPENADEVRSILNRSADRELDLRVDAEVVIKGHTAPNGQLTIKGERVWLNEDGSFMVRYNLPERRHVFPVVAVSRDGIETKTVVLAVERNTKSLETVIRDQNEDD